MKPNEYLKAVLADQDIEKHPEALKALNGRRKDVVAILQERFKKSKPTLKQGGSMAKGTMIWESYDLDIICYFPRENEDGDTIKELYEATEAALQDKYLVVRKNCALRLKEKVSDTGKTPEDFHIDVVPGRYVDGDEGNVYLHQMAPGKERLLTNPVVHVEHVRDSGVTDAIRLMKLWRTRASIPLKSFALELLVIKLLAGKKDKPLADQLVHLWTKLRDDSKGISIEDPANSGNDLSALLDDVTRVLLAGEARKCLQLVEDDKWEAIFGSVRDEDDDKGVRIVAAAAAVTRPIKSYAE